MSIKEQREKVDELIAERLTLTGDARIRRYDLIEQRDYDIYTGMSHAEADAKFIKACEE